ncbi:Dabb family protein [Aquisalinus flavus]|uniref:Stress-response A/B barrel domain-containing protein n=1 Tax=Aquisalinus flavus TaxID=1526572 RepID=A0A8J2V2A7_9PROT|nr:Dabb family protein [Aquisalinus flavus]GGC99388.1 hypothetical protein GCM10011342_05490 [Aquisalinus flavus]
MMRFLAILTLIFAAPFTAANAEDEMYSHLVFFELTDKSDDAKQALIDGFETYLAPHDGILVYTASIRDESKQRDVNDLTFDVALTLVFESVAAQDAYQVTDAHKQFIEELSGNWASVRVFDSTIPAGSLTIIGGAETE